MRSERPWGGAAPAARGWGPALALAAGLLLCTGIPILVAALRAVQVPLQVAPADTARLAAAPLAWFFHALAGAVFGLLGPLQFVRALRRRFGRLHWLAGAVFVGAGAVLAGSGLALLLRVETRSTGLLDAARMLLGPALIVALWRAVCAARAGRLARHAAWMVRAYAIGMGTGTVSVLVLPIVLLTGRPPAGLDSDPVLLAAWLITVAVGEGVARRLDRRRAVQIP